jgi:predicted metal-binding membrane protein
MAMTPSWVPMMTAMMVPAALPATIRLAGTDGTARRVPLFVGSYVAVWLLIGAALFELYRPPGDVAAGVLTIAAGLYELTPLKQECRRRCREATHSGVAFGLYCAGSSIGLMVLLLAVGPMSTILMAVVALVVLAQKLRPPAPAVDVPLALAIVALGVALAV